MRLNLAQLPAAVNQALAPIYVVAGEEPLLIQEALDLLRAQARRRGYAEREVFDVERGFDWGPVFDTYRTPSLFSSRRIVELRLQALPDAAGAEALHTLAQQPAADVLLLVCADKLEWKTRSGGWYAALAAAGDELYCEAVTPAQLPGWIAARLRAAGLQADEEAVQMLASRTEGHLLAAQQEIHKLALLYPNGRIGVEEIDAAVADSAHFEVFDWLDKILAGDRRGAVRALGRLREEGVELPQILGALAFDLHNWLAAVQGGALRAPKRRQALLRRAAARAGGARVRGWLRACARLDALAKGAGTQSQAWEELLTLALAATSADTAKTPV
jgi:DNA polymerase-3 subunit delta